MYAVARRNIVTVLNFKIKASSKGVLAMKSNTPFTHTRTSRPAKLKRLRLRLLSDEFHHAKAEERERSLLKLFALPFYNEAIDAMCL